MQSVGLLDAVGSSRRPLAHNLLIELNPTGEWKQFSDAVGLLGAQAATS